MRQRNKYSFLVLVSIYLFLIITHLYYPKWKMSQTEATLSWDVSGYYLYLPAFFIYKDLKNCSFCNEILGKYRPTPDLQQAFQHRSGRYVMKYSAGQAIQYLPFFVIGHIWATNSDTYPPDGFSFPYQLLISLGSLLVAFIGLYLIRLVLIQYFNAYSVAITLITLVLGTNYLNYSAIDGAQTHNYLFTIYSALIYSTIRFYNVPSFRNSVFIGFLVGLATLTRPTEIIAVLIPLMWGINLVRIEDVRKRIDLFKRHYLKVLVAAGACMILGSIQLFYWKYVTGEWLVYSYQDQGFSWQRPHIIQGFFSYKSGWITYSPVMIFSMFGFYFLFRKSRALFWSCLSYFVIFSYITFSWDIWWYGGSFGQRGMVQAYPILMIPMCSFIERSLTFQKYKRVILGMIGIAFCYLNLWFTHQAHRGGLLQVGEMTKAYYWKTLGRFDKSRENLKLLDTDEYFNGERKNVRSVYQNELIDSTFQGFCSFPQNQESQFHLCLNGETQFSPEYDFSVPDEFSWLRAIAEFKVGSKEWDVWKMTQFIVKFYKGSEVIKSRMIRVHRLLDDNTEKTIYLDVKIPDQDFNRVSVQFWNAGSHKEIGISNLRVESF